MKLSSEADKIRQQIIKDYSMSDIGGLKILDTALEAFERMRQCQERIKKDGIMIKDRFDQAKQHPLLATERDARAQLLQAFRLLNLDFNYES